MSRQGEQLSENIVSQSNLIDDEKKNLQNLEFQVCHFIFLHLLPYFQNYLKLNSDFLNFRSLYFPALNAYFFNVYILFNLQSCIASPVTDVVD